MPISGIGLQNADAFRAYLQQQQQLHQQSPQQKSAESTDSLRERSSISGDMPMSSEGIGGGFTEKFTDLLKQVNTEMAYSEKMAEAFARGETNNIHETMIAAEKAKLAFKLVGTLRNKMIDAYQEVMRMPM